MSASLLFDAAFRDTLGRLILARRDVRRFRPDEIPEEVITALLAQAHNAPSVGLSQPWRFVLVRDPARRQAVIEEFQRANQAAAAIYDDDRRTLYQGLKLAGLKEAPVHLLVCSETNPGQGHGLGRQTQPQTLRDSTVCAIQNLWLCARAAGIGMGWVSILEPERLRDVFDLPASWEWVGYFCIGYPQEDHMEPELARVGWEQPSPLEEMIFYR